MIELSYIIVIHKNCIINYIYRQESYANNVRMYSNYSGSDKILVQYE